MPNYKKMYYRMYNDVTDAIKILQHAQIAGENVFIEDDQSNIYRLIESEDEPEEYTKRMAATATKIGVAGRP